MDEALLAAFRATDYLVGPDEADISEAQVALAQPATAALARAWAAVISAHSVHDLEILPVGTSAVLADQGASSVPAHPAPAALAHPSASATPAHPAPAELTHPWASATPAHPAPTALAHPWASWSCIRVGQRLPAALQALAAERSWGFITAWHPHSQARPEELNIAAQRELLAALRAWPDAVLRSGVGVGAGGWYEPSLFVVGPDSARLDGVGRQYRQHAYVHGCGDAVAQLRWLDD